MALVSRCNLCLFFVIKTYPKEIAIIDTAKTGPIHSGSTFVPIIVEYDSNEATIMARPLNAYAIYLKPVVSNILENAERRTTLSSVSIGIIPRAKNPERINAVWIPAVADATADMVIAEICVAVSKPKPNTSPVTKEEPTGPSIPTLFRTLLASITAPLFPHFLLHRY